MNRRELIQTGVGGLGAVGALGAVGMAAMSNRASAENQNSNDPNPYHKVIKAAAHCIETGESCVAHCMAELGRGNVEMANCNKRVHEMLASCRTMLQLASYESEFAAKFAALCAEICKACEAACNEHREHWDHGMHLACKACSLACKTCAEECLAIAG